MESFEEVYQKYLNSRRTYPSRHLPLHLKNWKISEVNVNYRCGYVRLRSMNIMRGQKSRKDMQIN